ncbi:hypothetical protein MIR68_008609 [Amoeboaphelidium protococcarum]|nr:hypothetical protein MIR68_008609 [Amoeboaphelidium protococcarum]
MAIQLLRKSIKRTMNSYVQLVSTPSAIKAKTGLSNGNQTISVGPEMHPSLLIHTQQARYVINAPEGLQRLLTQYKIKLSTQKYRATILTRVNWSQTFGGMPGMILTYGDQYTKALNETRDQSAMTGQAKFARNLMELQKMRHTIVAPSLVTKALTSMRSFLLRSDYPLQTFEYGRDRMICGVDASGSSSSSDTWSDGNITVHRIALWSSQYDSADHESQLMYDSAAYKIDLKRDRKMLATMFKTPKSKSQSNSSDSDQTSDSDSDGSTNSSRQKRRRSQSPVNRIRRLSADSDQSSVVPPRSESSILLIQMPAKQPKFKADVAKQLGVSGPQIRQLLTDGQVTLNCGRVVTKDQVLEPQAPAAAFMVIDIPSTHYLPSLLQQQKLFVEKVNNHDGSFTVQSVFHILGGESMLDGEDLRIANDPSYKQFIKDVFNDRVQHIYVGKSYGPQYNAFQSSQLQLMKLNRLDSSIYPIQNGDSDQNSSSLQLGDNEHLGLPLLKVDVSGSSTYDNPESYRSIVDKSESISYMKLMPTEHKVQSYFDRRSELSALVSQCNTDSDVTLQQLQQQQQKQQLQQSMQLKKCVAFTGTGSMLPSKYRNVSGIVVFTGDDEAMMLDCGEGTYGQLLRLMGADSLADFLTRKLRLLFISHMHADHQMGIIRLLQEYNALRSLIKSKEQRVHNPLHIVGPSMLFQFLKLYSKADQSLVMDDYIKFIDAQTLLEDRDATSDPNLMSLYKNFDITAIRASIADHCPEAYGICVDTNTLIDADDDSVTTAEQKKLVSIVYSGDSRPCSHLVERSFAPSSSEVYSQSVAAYNDGVAEQQGPVGNACSDQSTSKSQEKRHKILIHECTFEDDMQREAEFRKHSTRGEALQMAQQMKASELLLTHYSQRYPKFSPGISPDVAVDNEISGDSIPVGNAFDLMVVPFGQVHKLARHVPALTAMFPIEDDNDLDVIDEDLISGEVQTPSTKDHDDDKEAKS